MLKNLRLSISLLKRELYAGEWLIIFFSLVLAVAAITTLHFYTDRLSRGLYQQSAKILGGDIVMTSATPLPEEWIKHAAQLQLRTAEIWSYPTMIKRYQQLQLINLQAVSQHYPLYDDSTGRPDQNAIWIEPRLFNLLALKTNDTVKIGVAEFRIAGTLPANLDSLDTGLLIAPKVIMQLEDVARTQTVLPGSRVEYRLLLAGDKNQLLQFRNWVIPRIKPGQRLLDIHNQQDMLKNILEKTENYLKLALLVCIVMAGTAIVLSTRLYLNRHYEQIALWRCLGARRKQIIFIFGSQLLLIALMAGLAGIIIGYYAQSLLIELFSSYLKFELPAAGFSPVLLGFITSIFLLFVFAYPVLSELPYTSPLYIWRNEVKTNTRHQTLYFLLAIVCSLIFIYCFMDFSLMALFFLNALTVSIGFMYILSLMILSFLGKILPKLSGSIRQGLSQLVHYPQSVILQMSVFILIIMSLFILQSIQANIIINWKQSLPDNTPNYFAINIAPEDVSGVTSFMESNQINMHDIYPMVRGRLTSLNEKPIFDAIPGEARQHNTLHRELNLSWMWDYPSDNKIVAGEKITQTDKNKMMISVEKNLATDFGLNLGDRLTFRIGEQYVTATIANFRTLDWKSFHPNFYFIFTPGSLDKFPTTYISSFYLNKQQTPLLNQLSTQYPSITIIDIASVLQQIQTLTSKVSAAIKYLFLFSVGIGLLILIVCIQASLTERHQTYRLFRVLGASNRFIRSSLAVEFTFLAILIAVVSYGLARIIIYLLLQRFF